MTDDEGRLREAYLELLRETGLDRIFADHRPAVPPGRPTTGKFDLEAAIERIRWHDQQSLRYETWESVGSEPLAEYLARLGTVRKDRGPYLGDRLPYLQDVLDRQRKALVDVLQASGGELPLPIYAGLYPTGLFNARVRPVAGGALILVNAGLMDLLFCVLKINLASSGDPSDPPKLDDGQVAMALADAFNAYLFGEGSLWAWGLPRLDPDREGFLKVVLGFAELFTLAHEIGHVALGHVRLPAQDGGKADVTLTPETELAADAFALDLLIRGGQIHDGSREAPFVAGGILAALVLACAITELSADFEFTQPSGGTHPALEDRWRRMEERLNELLPSSDPARRGETFRGWLTIRYLPQVAEWLRRVDEAIKRPGKYD